MPRAGLDPTAVVAAGAALADEVGLGALTMGGLAERVGVRTPSLYKHVAGQEDLVRRIAALALDEAAQAVGTAIQGLSGRDALAAAAHAFRAYVLTHPGRYAATIGVEATGPDDAMAVAASRALDSFRAVLRGYDVPAGDEDHALRTLRSALHGYATLQSAQGFRSSADVDESFEWMVDLLDRGLRAAPHRADPAGTAPTFGAWRRPAGRWTSSGRPSAAWVSSCRGPVGEGSTSW